MDVHGVLKSRCPEGHIRVAWQLATNVALGEGYCSLLDFAVQVVGIYKAVHGEYLRVAEVPAGVGRTLTGQNTWQQGLTGRAQVLMCDCHVSACRSREGGDPVVSSKPHGAVREDTEYVLILCARSW